MTNDMKLYYDYTISPLGKLFYKTVFHQLKDIKNKNILDFGSGFGFTSNFLAENNTVTALEVNESMIKHSENSNNYTLILGDLSNLKEIKSNSFDFISCHLVLEFVENPKEILNELSRLLKPNGTLSIIKHNKNGRIIQAIVQDFDLQDAKKLLNGGFSYSSAFGDIKYYENKELLNLLDNDFKITDIYGVRALASLHSEDIKNSDNWLNEMFEIELELLNNQDFINTAYFNHILLQKL